MATKEIPQIQVEKRERIGSRYAARLRQKGLLPAVIYGHGRDPLHVSLNRKKFSDLLHGHTHILEVKLGNETDPCLIKDVQWDHLGDTLMHVDLARVDLNERVTVEVELKLVGDAPGLKEAGAILEHPVSMIEIECLATQIPDSIIVDVSGLNAGDAIIASELKLPDGVTTTLDEDTVVATISIIAEAEEAEVVEGATGTEPEVIGKKLEEGTEAAPAPGGAKPAAGAKSAGKAGDKK